jgi:hypothetical protein
MPQLTVRGWARLGDPLPAAAAGELRIGTDRLQVVVDDQALLDDLNSASPDGWWSAVDALEGRCVVVLVRDGDVDLTNQQAGAQLAALMGTNRAVFAALPVVTILDD